ncbi:MAG: DUF3168 domain-containing protein [Intestinibacter bartlettii]|jgi:hypothetical protein|nr:DUF3168 domain-containing protein [Intestinibacter bartlettii]DAK61908.1 MAG TPA: hypothetical protein [Caudoviricetes sp.]
MISIELQEKLYALLSTLSYPVYDDVPKNAKCPYIKLGVNRGGDNSTKINLAYKDYQYIDVFSEYRGKKEVMQIMKQVNDLLQNKTITLENMQAFLYLNSSEILEQTDANGKYYHGILIYKINSQMKGAIVWN